MLLPPVLLPLLLQLQLSPASQLRQDDIAFIAFTTVFAEHWNLRGGEEWQLATCCGCQPRASQVFKRMLCSEQ